ncbi:NAD(P)-dependent oxidoreductase [Pedobacter sp. BS3]|uniref:NAD(P)-dependent oxidoreductase n=1 Tax=Pedobacter sp. BS3 TaxID=2567937 RepID=UPI0011EC8063|nr:NAD(P)-dependent oxidoreductase [Pedobacter sp. BS3]TZF82286.1 NAD(P)-dependent oxidoreductase [Pedobacter sp. BS3]
MKIALIGAGFTGSAVLNEALSRGMEVTVIVRHPEKVTVKSNNLHVVKADVLHEDISGLLAGHDAVISTYNAGWDNENLYNDFIKGSENLQAAAKKSGVKRLLVIGGAGSLEVAPGVQAVDTPEFPAAWKTGATAARDYLNILKKEEQLDWTFLSPAFHLEPGQRTGKFRLGKDNPVVDANGESKISVEDLAVALLNETENPQFIRQRFTVGY